MKATVRRMLENKGNQIWSVSPGATIFDALQVMAEKEIGALLVMEGDELLGIISERDYARKVVLKGKSSKDTLVSEIMSPKIFYVSPQFTAEECMSLMLDKRIRHLPVYEDKKLAGMISIGDVVKAVIDGKDWEISELEHYITGTR
ncbi:MAG: CBS domain-containing protein [Ignavibacteriaceae bacterium]